MNLVDPKDILAASETLNKIGGLSGAKLLMHFLKIGKLNRIYAEISEEEGLKFIDSLIASLNVNFEVDEESLKNIPKEGAFITISNHPFGGIDGILLLKLLLSQRPDFKVIANFLLKKVKPLSEFIFAVNPFESRPDIKSTVGLKSAIKHLKEGFPLGIFPAGEVSTFQKGFRITDKKWDNGILRFIKKAEVPVLPIYFDGNNSNLFYLLGKIHPMLRTVKLPSELLNKQNKTIKIIVGKPITVKEQESFSDIHQYGRYLRANTFTLANTLKIKDFFKEEKRITEIISEIPKEIIEEEVLKLPKEDILFTNRNYTAYFTSSSRIPNTLREIGRLREHTFTAVGEGSNKSLDLDEYDIYYKQLFLWDSEAKRIAGAYRVGRGKEIMQLYGSDGFYIKSLFKIRKKFHPVLEESLELGRSFIPIDYQKKPLPLFLLWKGITHLLLKNPEYRYLIGPVSISNDYSDISKSMIVQFIMKYHFDYNLSSCIKPRHKFKHKIKNVDTEIIIQAAQEDINLLDKYIGKFEASEVRLPVLLKKYISLNAKIIGFNRDPLFNNCLDGLIVLDIYDIPTQILKKLSEELDKEQFKVRFDK